jgi:hypothetical protein
MSIVKTPQINWDAIEKARNFWRYSREKNTMIPWEDWILKEAGILNEGDYIRVIDPKQYLFFVLKWS